MARKCIHTIAIDNWFPELCSVTIPLMEAWAYRIGADFRIIDKAKFKEFPPNFEKFQIWESGKDYDWNIYLDADMIINPDTIPDFTEQDPRYFYYESRLVDLSSLFLAHPYFLRDGRNFGVSDCFLVGSSFVHDLWHPLGMSFERACRFCPTGERFVSEFAICLNIARFGLKGLGTIGPDKSHFHLQTTDDQNRPWNGGEVVMTKEEHVVRAIEMRRSVGII